MSNYTFEFINVKRAIDVDSKPVESRIQGHINANGLAYHPTFGENDKWTVTHVPSGYTLCNETRDFDDEDQCQYFIEMVNRLSNWSAVRPSLTSGTKELVRKLALEAKRSKAF